MKIALAIPTVDEDAQFARQLGLSHVVSSFPFSASPLGYLEYDDLMRARSFFARHELSLDVIENVPMQHYYRAMFGLPGRDEQIANVCRTIRNMGRAGIGVFGYHWMLLGGLRTGERPGRGGASLSHFDLDAALRAPMAALDWRVHSDFIDVDLAGRELPAEEVWDNLTYFLRRVLPVAEEAGVRLAAHPDDVPVPSFLGVARILSSLDGLQRLVDAIPSPCNGLDFCQGTVAEMPGVGARVVDAIYRFGRQGKIFSAHFRNCRGTMPCFDEVFPDEGDADMLSAMRAYADVGFEGLVRADHSPGMVGDDPARHRGFAFEIGYMKGLLQAVKATR